MNERGRAIKEAVRVELKTLLDEDDLSSDILGRISNVADHAQSIIKAIEAPIGAQATMPVSAASAVQASLAFLGAPTAAGAPLLPEQTPGETMMIRLLKELLAVVRQNQPSQAALPAPADVLPDSREDDAL